MRLAQSPRKPSVHIFAIDESGLQLVGTLDDRADIRSLPVGGDPAHPLVMPTRCRATPVAAYHEAMKEFSAAADTLQFLELAQTGDLDRTGKKENLFEFARSRKERAMATVLSSLSNARY
jgi:hypothetical protein